MTDTRRSPAEALLARLDPVAEAGMRDLIAGSLKTQAVYVAAKLGIADQLALGPRTAADLSDRLQVHAGSLRRLMRFLVTCGVFLEGDDGRFALARAGESLQSAHPRSLRMSAIRAGEGMWTVSSRLLDAVRTGRTAYEDVHGATFFERMSDAESSRAFSGRMNGSAPGLGSAIAALDCMRDARTVVDVGGGHGALLFELLRTRPSLRGVLFDRAAAVEDARAQIESSELHDRCVAVPGDFFEGVPEGGDVYVLSWVLHDWSDDQALRIVRACREAGGDDAVLLVVEMMLPEHAAELDGTPPGMIADPFTLDLQMLLLTGGRERTAREYASLLDAAGYGIVEVSTPASARGASLVEARVRRP